MATNPESCWQFDRSFELSGMFPGFPEEGKNSPEILHDSGEEDDDEDTASNVEENRVFWNSQYELLQETLRRRSSIECKIRQATKTVLRELNCKSIPCGCRGSPVSGCRRCLQTEICSRLRNVGFNCVICKSKWKSSPEILSGEHTYLEVVGDSNVAMELESEVRVIIELSFRAEFQIARASEEYERLVGFLPEVFIGKSKRLRELIKIVCNAAKKCMKERKMHLGPWRKQGYMQAKWLGKCERTTPESLPVGFSGRPSKAKASLLTFDLQQNLAVRRCSVEVV